MSDKKLKAKDSEPEDESSEEETTEETEETEARAVASDARETIARAAEARAAQEEEEVVVRSTQRKKKRAPREPKVGSRAYKKLMPRCEFINPKSGCQCRCKCENMADTLCKKHAIVKIQCDPANWKRLDLVILMKSSLKSCKMLSIKMPLKMKNCMI